jgi:nucleotide-binding universal stress UspA family protein
MFDKILVGLDGSESSVNALNYAIHIAQQEGAELLLVSAVEPLPPIAYTPGGPPTYIPQMLQNMIDITTKMQNNQIEILKKNNPDIKVTGIVEVGRAATVIKDAGKTADLIVVGHRGTGGLLSWVLGSVAKEVVDQCTVPVIIVKDRDYCKQI